MMKENMKIIILFVSLFILCATEGESFDYYRLFYREFQRKQCPIPRKCTVKLLQKERNHDCVEQRKNEIAQNRLWYQITEQGKPQTIKFPLTQVPFLNQTLDNTNFHYAVDPDEGRYFMLLSTWLRVLPKISSGLNSVFGKVPVTTFALHKTILKHYREAVKNLRTPQHFSNPSLSDDFTDHLADDSWRTDEAFVQRRLAGTCPFMLRKVTEDGENGFSAMELSKKWNKEVYNTDTLIDLGDGEKLSIVQAIEQGRLFVLYIEEMENVPTTPDITDTDPNDNRVMRNITSPITLFVLKNDGMLKVVAIQMDSHPEAEVFLPDGSLGWEIAKIQVEFTSNSYCQAAYHLGGVHFAGTIYCLAYRRHFSSLHPLYDFFKYHCEGTTPQISVMYGLLVAPNSGGDRSFTFGAKGFAQLSSTEFAKRYYGHYDLDKLTEGRGLDDKRIKYYPFRDDVKVILKELEHYARGIVKLYYPERKVWRRRGWRYYEEITNEVEGLDGYENINQKIKSDIELQSFANEISIEGKGPNGGLGKMPGFPARFEESGQLVRFLVRFMWYNVIHTVSNYPLAPAFVPNLLGKSYTRKDGEVSGLEEVFPGYDQGNLAIERIQGRSGVANFRANRILDYYDKVKDNKLKKLARVTYYRLHGCVQETLEKRNAARKAQNLLGYQYLEPKWMTNSVHI